MQNAFEVLGHRDELTKQRDELLAEVTRFRAEMVDILSIKERARLLEVSLICVPIAYAFLLYV